MKIQMMQNLYVTSIQETQTTRRKDKEVFILVFFHPIFFKNKVKQKKLDIVVHGLSLQAFYPIEERHDEYEKDNFIVDVEEEAHDGKNM
jgi:hypothetical protein